MRSSKRKKRLQRKQRLEQFGADNDKESSPVPESPQSTSSTSPYPYHQHIKAPPPTYTNLENRAASENSLVSEMTMEDFGGAHESVLEYSDTSDDNRYFMPPSNNMVRDNRARKVDSGESAFRDLRATGSQSSRVVDFSSDRPAFPFDDEGSNPQANSALLHPRPSQPRRVARTAPLLCPHGSPSVQRDHGGHGHRINLRACLRARSGPPGAAPPVLHPKGPLSGSPSPEPRDAGVD